MRSASEQPSVWHVIVTIVAMVYLGYFSMGPLVALYNPTLALSASFFALGSALVWAFLIRDLIKQVSLFFRRKRL